MMSFREYATILMGILTITSAAVVVFHRNIIYASFSLILTFFGIAGLFISLSADFVAGVQVLIYIGGILILFLFAIMLSYKLFGASLFDSRRRIIPSLLIALPLFFLLLYSIFNTEWEVVDQAVPQETLTRLGNLILDHYILPFELASVLLLGALVGSVYLVRSKE